MLSSPIEMVDTIRQIVRFISMRLILFYSGIESFNYYTDELMKELSKRGHTFFILDLRDAAASGPHSLYAMMDFIKSGTVDAAIGYDQMTTISQDYCDLWNEYHIPVVSIYVDPSYRFGGINGLRLDRSVRYCCDLNDVSFCRRFYHALMPNVFFMPHAGTIPTETPVPWEQRKYDLLFSGTWYDPDGYLSKIKDSNYEDWMKQFLLMTADFLKQYPEYSVLQAVDRLVSKYYPSFDESAICNILEHCENVDWYARMYYRTTVMKEILSSGMEVYLLGRGWENLPAAKAKNVHILSDRIAFADSLRVMADARINLNVMPWFKDGTHERVFNALLRDSALLTNDSLWLQEHFKDHQNIFYYDLRRPAQLPSMIQHILSNPTETKKVIESGKKIAEENFTWKNLADQLEADIAQFN